jgi:polyisoprenoid-binding protein YceI
LLFGSNHEPGTLPAKNIRGAVRQSAVVISIDITVEVSRGGYGMNFNQVLGSGNVLVSDKVKISLVGSVYCS